jgi:hypothetical protein
MWPKFCGCGSIASLPLNNRPGRGKPNTRVTSRKVARSVAVRQQRHPDQWPAACSCRAERSRRESRERRSSGSMRCAQSGWAGLLHRAAVRIRVYV